MDQYLERHFHGHPPDLFASVAAVVRSRLGREIDKGPWNCESVDDALRHPDDGLVKLFLSGVVQVLLLLEQQRNHAVIRVDARRFIEVLNQILEEEGRPDRLSVDGWTPIIQTQAELIRRVLLEGRDDVAPCRQGDIQVETVASTIQAKLSVPGAALLDYGAGLGRVLKGLSSAPLLGSARYVAVDEPISPALEALAREVGVPQLVTRSQFLEGKSEERFDAAFVLNVLHHIPFNDLARQFRVLISSLKTDGILVVHEMGELRDPEQKNVPWTEEDIVLLLTLDGLTVNPRSTTSSGKRVPLTNCIVTAQRVPAEKELHEQGIAVWNAMKKRTLERIDQLYRAKDPAAHLLLQHALIINANLDLNRPT